MRRPVLLLVALTLLAWCGSAAAAPLDRLVARGLARAGGASGGYVLDATTDQVLAAVRGEARLNPASVEKLYTTSTALLRFGPNATLQTRVLGAGALDPATGTWNGDLYLRGGGDPTLGDGAFDRRAYGLGSDVATLAAQLRAAGIVRVAGRVLGDESWLDALRGDPASGYGLDLGDLGGPLSALLFDRGQAKPDGSAVQRQPALFAAQQLTLALRRAGVSVPRGVTTTGIAPPDARALAVLDSPPMATLVRLTLVPSDNMLAEELVKDIGAQFGGAGSTAAGAAVVRRTLLQFRIHPQVVDGSGLSRADRTSPHQVVVLLNGMRANAALRAGLPVAGRTGTLAFRMRRTPARDRCQAKTGTLSNVSALAGYCTTANGHLLAFAFIENGVFTPRAKAAEDGLVVALARLRPSIAPPVVPPPATTPAPPPTAPTTPTPAPPSSGGGASASS